MAGPLNRLAGWASKGLLSSLGGAGVGAGVGAISNPDDPLGGAEVGAATGAIAGPTGLGAERIVSRAALPLARYLLANPTSTGRIRKNALDEVLGVMHLDELDPSALRHRLDATPDVPLTLADVGGENLLSRADAAAQIPGPSRNAAVNALRPRFENQPERITALIQQHLTPSLDARSAMKDIQQAKKDEAANLYGAWYQAHPQVMNPDLDAMMPRLEAAGALKNAETLSGIKGVELPKPTVVQLPDGTTKQVYQGLSAHQLDQIKRGLDDAIAAAKRTGGGEQLAALTELKHQYLGVLDAAAPGYADARKSFAGYSSSQNALEEGQGFDKGRLEDTLQYFNSLDPGDQEFFRMGVGQRIKDLVGSGQEGQDAVKKFFKNRETKNKLRLLFPDPASFEAFSHQLNQELTMARTNNAVMGGSPSYKRFNEGANRVGAGSVMAALVHPSTLPNLALDAAMNLAGSSAAKLDQLTGAEVTKMLLNPNLHVNRQTLQALQDRQHMQRIKSIISGGLQTGAALVPAAGAAAFTARPLEDTSQQPPQMAEGGRVTPPQDKRIDLARGETSPLGSIIGGETYIDPSSTDFENTDVGITDFMIPFSDELDAYLATAGSMGLGPKHVGPVGRGLPDPHSPAMQDWNRRWSQRYDDRLALERSASDAYAENHPAVALTGSMLSYLPMLAMGPEGLAGGAVRTAPRIARAAGQLSNRALSYALEIAPETSAKLLGALNRAASSVASSSPAAAVYGFDQGEGGLGNRLEAAKESLLQNAPMSALFPWLGPLSRAAKQLLTRELGSTAAGERRPVEPR